ncbi:MAG: hypothetical protein ABR968_06630 [Bacteroidales bacterium]
MKKLSIFFSLVVCVYFVDVLPATAQTNTTTNTKPETIAVPKTETPQTDKKVVSKDEKTPSPEQNKPQVTPAKATTSAENKNIDTKTTPAPETSKANQPKDGSVKTAHPKVPLKRGVAHRSAEIKKPEGKTPPKKEEDNSNNK